MKESNTHQEQDGFSKTAFGILNLLFGKLRKVERDNRQVKEDSFGRTQRRYKKVKGKKKKKRNTWEFHIFNCGWPFLRTFFNIHKWAHTGTGVNHQRHLVDRSVMVSSHSWNSHQISDLSASPLS